MPRRKPKKNTVRAYRRIINKFCADFGGEELDYTFKYSKKLERDILDSQNKIKMPGHCGFPLANLYDAPIGDFVPAPTILDYWKFVRFVDAISKKKDLAAPVLIKAQELSALSSDDS